MTAVSYRFSENSLEENHILERTDRKKLIGFGWIVGCCCHFGCRLVDKLAILSEMTSDNVEEYTAANGLKDIYQDLYY